MPITLGPPEGYRIERLDTTIHDRNGFSCGVVPLDEFLRTQASQQQTRNLLSTHVLTENKPPVEGVARTVVSYVSLVSAEVPLVDCPEAIKKLTKHPRIPVVLLARMGVDSNHKKKGLGEYLLKFAFKCAWDISQLAGCYAVVVDAKDEQIKEFYTKYGFMELPDRPLRLFLPIATMREFFKQELKTVDDSQKESSC